MSSFSFIHASDLHIDGRFEHLGDFAQPLRRYILETFDLIISLTEREKVSALLISGDLFDSPVVSGETLELVKTGFETLAPLPVFIAPGNSDPFTPDSSYATDKWPENVHIFSENRMVSVEVPGTGAIIHGFAHIRDREEANPLEDYQVQNPTAINILFFHGSIVDVGYPDQNIIAPFKFKHLTRSGADYAALGHFHKVQSLKKRGEKTIMGCYPGIPQGIDFSDDGEKGILKVEISRGENGKKDIKFLPTARKKFKTLTLNCTGMEDEAHIIEGLKTIIDEVKLKDFPTRISLKGWLDREEPLDISRIRREVCQDCLLLRIENKIINDYDVDMLKTEKTTRGLFAKAMLEKIDAVENGNEEELETLHLALKYGLDSFSRKEVKKRWL